MQLVFWDYYDDDEASYKKWLQKHKLMGFEPIMASGIWSWFMLWYGHEATVQTVDPCIQVCREEGIRRATVRTGNAVLRYEPGVNGT